MKLFKFIWLFVKYILIYLVSVLPAAVRDAWCESFHYRPDQRNDNRSDRNNGDGYHKKRRRGHRGGRKHRRKFYN